MNLPASRRRIGYRSIYILWILLCAVLFLALRHAEDPSRRHDRILSNDAAIRALQLMQSQDRARFHDYEAVHVAYAAKGEGEKQPARWIVLLDRVPHTALGAAVVVELDAKDGSLLTVRKPSA